MTIYLSEQQRTEAIAACDRIQSALEKQRIAFENIIRILDNLAKGRDPKDGLIENPE